VAFALRFVLLYVLLLLYFERFDAWLVGPSKTSNCAVACTYKSGLLQHNRPF
jgi:hypothetical protein